MMSRFDALRSMVEQHRITFAVVFALIVTMILTSISMALYVTSGASRLDLSRPGYEKVRSGINPIKEEAFSSNGPINTDVANDFQKRFDRHRTNLNKLDNFGSNALEDSELQIAPDSAEQQ